MAKPKRKKPGHRPKLPGARYPCGKLRPRDAGATPELLAQRAKLVGPAKAHLEDAGWLIGIMYLRGELHPPREGCDAQAREDIARHRRDAAERFVRLQHVMQRLIQTPKRPQAVDPMQTPGMDGQDDPVFYARVRAEHHESQSVLEEAGHMPMIAVIRACRDEWAPLSYLPAGLDALHEGAERIARAGRRAATAARDEAA